MFGNNYGYGSNAWNSPYGSVVPAQSANSIMCVMVNSEDDVRRYLVAANTTVMLVNFNAKKFYLKGTDANGIQVPIREFDFEEKTLPVQVTTRENAELDAINEKLKKLEEMITAMGVKQNVSE